MTFRIAVAGIAGRRRRPGDDDVVRTSLRCGSCEAPIGAGEVYAVVTDAALVRCLDCAAAIVHAGWDRHEDGAVCPWPPPPLGDTATPDVVDVIDFRARLHAASARGRALPPAA